MAFSKSFPFDLCSTKIVPFHNKSIKPCLLSAFFIGCSKLATRIYDVKTVAVNSEVRQAYTEIAATRQNIYAETQPDVSAKVASIFQ